MYLNCHKVTVTWIITAWFCTIRSMISAAIFPARVHEFTPPIPVFYQRVLRYSDQLSRSCCIACHFEALEWYDERKWCVAIIWVISIVSFIGWINENSFSVFGNEYEALVKIVIWTNVTFVNAAFIIPFPRTRTFFTAVIFCATISARYYVMYIALQDGMGWWWRVHFSIRTDRCCPSSSIPDFHLALVGGWELRGQRIGIK